MLYLFIALAIVAFISGGIHSLRRNGCGMTYSFAVCFAWVLMALWWSGRL